MVIQINVIEDGVFRRFYRHSREDAIEFIADLKKSGKCKTGRLIVAADIPPKPQKTNDAQQELQP